LANKDYKAGVGTLTNPLNDIRIVGEALKAVGFESPFAKIDNFAKHDP
jgi:hypothetical protein